MFNYHRMDGLGGQDLKYIKRIVVWKENGVYFGIYNEIKSSQCIISVK